MKIPSQNRKYTIHKLIDMSTNCPKDDLSTYQTIEDAIYWLQQDESICGLRSKMKVIDDYCEIPPDDYCAPDYY